MSSFEGDANTSATAGAYDSASTVGAVWSGTTEGNPMVYTHLYHGEFFDGRKLGARLE